jgi:protein CpxP
MRSAAQPKHNPPFPSIKKPFSAPEKGFFVPARGLGPLLANTLVSANGAAALPAFPFFFRFLVSMKKSLFLLAAMAFATASFAQAPATTTQLPTHRVHRMGDHTKAKGDHQAKTPEQRADKHTAMLTKKLSLTAEQQPQVRQILLAQAQEAQTLKTQYPADTQRKARHEAMKAGQAKYQAQLQGVLKPDQYSKLLTMKQERHHKGGKHADKSKTKA